MHQKISDSANICRSNSIIKILENIAKIGEPCGILNVLWFLLIEPGCRFRSLRKSRISQSMRGNFFSRSRRSIAVSILIQENFVMNLYTENQSADNQSVFSIVFKFLKSVECSIDEKIGDIKWQDCTSLHFPNCVESILCEDNNRS